METLQLLLNEEKKTYYRSDFQQALAVWNRRLVLAEQEQHQQARSDFFGYFWITSLLAFNCCPGCFMLPPIFFMAIFSGFSSGSKRHKKTTVSVKLNPFTYR